MSGTRFVQLLSIIAGVLATALVPRQAVADNPAAAEALFEQARAAMAAGSFDIACARFRDSDKLDPAVGTRFNLADCEERRGRLATAWSLFRGVLAELALDDDRLPIAEQRVAALQRRLPYLTMVRTLETPADVRVRVDGVELGPGSLGVALPMDPGEHELDLLVGNDPKEHRSHFALREGEHKQLPILFGAEAPAAATAELPVVRAQGDATESQREWAYTAGAIGAASFAFGAVTGIVTLNKKSTASANCNEQTHVCNRTGVDANESGKTFAALSGVGFGVGLVGLATGAYLLLNLPDRPASAHSSIPVRQAGRLSPELALASGTGFISVSGRF